MQICIETQWDSEGERKFIKMEKGSFQKDYICGFERVVITVGK